MKNVLENLEYQTEGLEEETLLERQRQVLVDGEYKDEAINGIYRDWADKNKSGALALEKKYSEDLEETFSDLELDTYKEYIDLGEKTGLPQPYAAAAVTAKEHGLPDELYEDAVYKVGETCEGMARQDIEKAYGIAVDEIREVMNKRSTEEELYPDSELNPAF